MKIKARAVPDGKGGYERIREVIYDIPPKPDCFVVMGSIRGGTSLTAGILQHLGIEMGPHDGQRFDESGKVSGYYEDARFSHLAHDMVGIHWHWDGTGSLWYDSRRVLDDPPYLKGYYLQWFTGLIQQREQDQRWGLKNLALYVFWSDFVRICHSNIHVIKVNRDIKAVAKSIQNSGSRVHMDLPFSDWLAIAGGWHRLREQALKDWIGPIMSIDFETILADPQWSVERIADFCGLSPTLGAVRFVEPGLRHF